MGNVADSLKTIAESVASSRSGRHRSRGQGQRRGRAQHRRANDDRQEVNQ